MTEQERTGRGGDRGGRRPKIGKARPIKMPDDLWEFCLVQPQGGGEFVRELIEKERKRQGRAKGNA